MAFFIAAGVISNDVIRRETSKGVLTTFRLETGAPRGRKLWIDVECWGHLAGTMGRHATKGRGVSVSGRLIHKTWRDKNTGDARHRYVIKAIDIDLHPADELVTSHPPNSVILKGTIETIFPDQETMNGVTTSLQVADRGLKSKTSRLQIEVRCWRLTHQSLAHVLGSETIVVGCLQTRPIQDRSRPSPQIIWAFHYRLTTSSRSTAPTDEQA